MGKVKVLFNKLWLLAKGNKTIFFTMLWAAIEAGLIPLTGGWITFARILLAPLISGSIYDHYKSGHFKAVKMVPKKT